MLLHCAGSSAIDRVHADDKTLITGAGSPDVSSQRLPGHVPVAAPEGVEQFAVRTMNFEQLSGVRFDRAVKVVADSGHQGPPDGDEDLLARTDQDGAMKGDVWLDDAGVVLATTSLFQGGQNVVPRAEVAPVQLVEADFSRAGLDGAVNRHDQFAERIWCRESDRDAAIASGVEQPLLGQLGQCLTHRPAVDAEALSQVRFSQPLWLGPPAAEEVLTDQVGDLFPRAADQHRMTEPMESRLEWPSRWPELLKTARSRVSHRTR